MAKQQGLVIKQGENWSQTIQVLSGTDSPFDLTGHILRGQMRREYASTSYQDLHPTLSITPTDGFFTLTLSNTETSALKAGRWVYDVEAVNGEVVTHIVEGIILVTPEVTR
jgi:hypothetical protein